MKRIDEKIESYLNEAGEYIDVEDTVKATLIKYQMVDSCSNCFFGLEGWDEGKITSCENPEVGMILTGEKYHGQYNMGISPNGKCKFWRHGRGKRKW